ncbi:MAG: L-aspartate oxidase [Oscillospiraceae bacterium]|jgi:L-aspartate oxidase|nr:L-aspartate oxidase [Oscillospiraceae bacterium]
MRFAFNGNTAPERIIDSEVVIIGSGLAGLYTALNCAPEVGVHIITKEDIDLSNSWLAQGGIAAAILPEDEPRFHFDDTLAAGDSLCYVPAVQTLVTEGPKEIRKLRRLRVPFDLDDYGDLMTTREGGHRMNRIVHAGGDATGREAVKTLSAIVLNQENVKSVEHTELIDVITDPGGALSGVLVRSPDGSFELYRTRSCVLATGGIGEVYASSTNPHTATGDGVAAAIRAGAECKHLEFVQFHPTGLFDIDGKYGKRAFLISEAVRGEGGLLKNSRGERFMLGQHELAELAPRDIVARGILAELAKSGEPCAWLDVRHLAEKDGAPFFAKRFPTIFAECTKRGIDIAKDLIPVYPVQHYLMGGIKTDLHARTTIPGLYAVGEAACTGVHGANRLASNSMLECLVFGRRAAEQISAAVSANADDSGEYAFPTVPERPKLELGFGAERAKLQNIMHANVGALKSEAGMTEAKEYLTNLLNTLESGYNGSGDYRALLNIATVANAIVEASLKRKKSVGSHYVINNS